MRVAIDTSALVERHVAIQGGAELQPIFVPSDVGSNCASLPGGNAFNRMR